MITTNHLSTQNIVVKEDGNIVSDMGGEKVMLSVSNGKYYNLGEVGGEIWDLTEAPIIIEEIIIKLINQYDVEKEQCEEQVLSFLQLMLKEKLIRVQEK